MRSQLEVTEMLQCKPYCVAPSIQRNTAIQKLWSVCMEVGSWICLVMVGQLKPRVQVLGFLIWKGSKMMDLDLDQNLFLSTVNFDASFYFHRWYYVIQYRCWCHDQWPAIIVIL